MEELGVDVLISAPQKAPYTYCGHTYYAHT
jgi:aspartate aminotransferase-like enzyme